MAQGQFGLWGRERSMKRPQRGAFAHIERGYTAENTEFIPIALTP